MAILNLNLEKATTREEINEYLRQMAMHSDLQKQIDFVSSRSGFVGSRYAGVVDAEATICNDNRVVLYVLVRQRVRLQLPGSARDGRHGWGQPAGLPALMRKA